MFGQQLHGQLRNLVLLLLLSRQTAASAPLHRSRPSAHMITPELVSTHTRHARRRRPWPLSTAPGPRLRIHTTPVATTSRRPSLLNPASPRPVTGQHSGTVSPPAVCQADRAFK